MWTLTQSIGLVLLALCFLGFCRHCYYLERQFLHCKACGATRLQFSYDALDADVTERHAMVVNRTEYRCDGPTEECHYMDLVVRKWSWRLSRPFAWIWSPLPSLLNAVIAILKK